MRRELIKSEQRGIPGTSLKANVTITWFYDDEPVEGSVAWDDPDAEKEYYQRFYNGELINAVIRVRAEYEGVEADDYLGGNHIRARNLEADILLTVDDYGMIGRVLDDLGRRLVSMKYKLAEGIK